MQAWDFESFTVGYPADSFERYAQKFAKWQKVGDLVYAEVSKMIGSPGNSEDLAQRFQHYFKPSAEQAVGYQSDQAGYVTTMMADAAGYRLEFSMMPRLLKIEPGQWVEAAPLPETNPDQFLFWYCPTFWNDAGVNSGGDLVVNRGKEGLQTFKYSGQRRAVLVQDMPHVLTEINPKAKKPYYCLYGQLVEAK